jgi:2'-5' RNA ligase
MGTPHVIRAFIAIELPPHIRQELNLILKQLQARLSRAAIRWVPANNIHITLKFLGDVSVSNLDLLKKILDAEGRRHKPFDITVSGLGAYPTIHRPRVIWVGVEAPAEMEALHHSIEAETQRLGYAAEERRFSPHLTLGRISHTARPQDIHDISNILSGYTVGNLGVASVEKVVLFRSDLTSGGAIYTSLHSALLHCNSTRESE